MNMSIGKRSLQNARRLFICLSNSCFTDIMRGRSPPVIRSTSKHLFSSATAASSPSLLRLELYSLYHNSRFISITKCKYFYFVSPIFCRIFYTSKLQSVPHPKSLKPHKHSAALNAKFRKKVAVPRPDNESGIAEVVAYAISEEIILEQLDDFLANNKLYQKEPLPSDLDDAIYIKAVSEVDRHCIEVFFFREGVIVFWNMSYLERNAILQHVRKFCDSPYDLLLTLNESLTFCYTDNPQTNIKGYEIQFSSGMADAHVLEKYAFSNSLGQSVKLAMWEHSLAQFVESIEPFIDDLRCGRKIRISRENILRKLGELFTLRHLVNLRSDLLDTPDFYWDRESLQPLYQKTIDYLNVAKRTQVMNDKLKLCCELIKLLSDHLNDQHYTHLEVIIIVLLMVEVMFAIIHYIEK